jgi:hypothetical protein
VILAALLEKLEEPDRVGDEDEPDDDCQPRQVPLDDVRAALRGGREAHSAEAGVPPGVHEDQPEQGERDEDVPDRKRLQHLPPRVPEPMPEDVRAQIQKLLVTGDNRLKQGVGADKVRATYEQAFALAREAGLEDVIRPLVEVRLADLERLAAPEA